MTPARLFVGILLCLAMHLPMALRVGHTPMPSVIGVRDSSATDGSHTETGMLDLELVKYGITQGGLTIVCLVVFAFYRRDFLKKQRDSDGDKAILIGLVEKNTKANARLAMALERLQLVAGEAGDDN